MVLPLTVIVILSSTVVGVVSRINLIAIDIMLSIIADTSEQSLCFPRVSVPARILGENRGSLSVTSVDAKVNLHHFSIILSHNKLRRSGLAGESAQSTIKRCRVI